MKYKLTCIFIILPFVIALGQDDLMALADRASTTEALFVVQTFKGTRLINGHSVETRERGVLDVIISHRFGRLNSGGYHLFGLDESNVRLGMDYGITDGLNVGIGRNSFEKTFDGFLKYRIVRQPMEARGMPVSVAAFASTALKTLRTGEPGGEPPLSARLSYCYQLIVARKFSPALSLQVSPTIVHRNTVAGAEIQNSIVALGGGGRVKLSKRLSLNLEYFHQFNQNGDAATENSLAIGFDIETGGHVFQLHLTNARAMIEKGFITETNGDFFDGDVHFGFNISRVFQLHE